MCVCTWKTQANTHTHTCSTMYIKANLHKNHINHDNIDINNKWSAHELIHDSGQRLGYLTDR